MYSWNDKWVMNLGIKEEILGLRVYGHTHPNNRVGSKTRLGLIYNTLQLFLQGGEMFYDKME